MKTDYEKQFLLQQQLKCQTLKALIQKKHEIRINFSNSQGFRLLQMHLQNQCNYSVFTLASKNQPPTQRKRIFQRGHNRICSFESNQSHIDSKDDSLFEVIQRQRSRLASIGWSQSKPLMRNSAMSRTYRRKKNIQKHDGPQFTMQQSKQSHQINEKSHRSVNLIDSSIQINKYSANCSEQNKTKILEGFHTYKQGNNTNFLRHFNSNDHISFFLSKKSSLSLPESKLNIKNRHIYQKKGNKKINFQSQNSYMKQKKDFCNPQHSDKNYKENNGSDQVKKNSFIHQKKASFTVRRERALPKTIEPLNIDMPDVPQAKKESIKIEGPCRPWTPNKHGQEKVDDPQEIKEVTPLS